MKRLLLSTVALGAIGLFARFPCCRSQETPPPSKRPDLIQGRTLPSAVRNWTNITQQSLELAAQPKSESTSKHQITRSQHSTEEAEAINAAAMRNFELKVKSQIADPSKVFTPVLYPSKVEWIL